MLCLHKILLLDVRGIGERPETATACQGVHRGCKSSFLTHAPLPFCPQHPLGSVSGKSPTLCRSVPFQGLQSLAGSSREVDGVLSSCRVAFNAYSLGGGTGPRRSHLPGARECPALPPLLPLSKGQIPQGFLSAAQVMPRDALSLPLWPWDCWESAVESGTVTSTAAPAAPTPLSPPSHQPQPLQR